MVVRMSKVREKIKVPFPSFLANVLLREEAMLKETLESMKPAYASPSLTRYQRKQLDIMTTEITLRLQGITEQLKDSFTL